MENYLASGMLKGVGPHLASVMMVLGIDVFTIIEAQPERLLELPGIGRRSSGRLWSRGRSTRRCATS